LKQTIDLGNEWLVAGCQLQADGEKILNCYHLFKNDYILP